MNRSIHITRWYSVCDNVGRPDTMTWQVFESMLSSPVVAHDKKATQAWSPALLGGTRCAANVQRVTALVLDHDHGTSPDDAAMLWGTCAGGLHTTMSHKPDDPRFRVVLWLSRDVSTSEFVSLWHWADARARGHGQEIDRSCKDPSRVWIVPAVTPGGSYEHRVFGGAPLDADMLLANLPRHQVRPTGSHTPGTAMALVEAKLSPRVRLLLQSERVLKGLWAGQREHGDRSQSGCDFALARTLLSLRVPAEDVARAVAARPGAHRRDARYIRVTVERACESLKGKRP